MLDEEVRVAVYVVTGFLESGKTTFLNYTMRQDYFQIPDTTLVITTEEGEEEYDKEELKKYNTAVEVIEEEEDLNFDTLKYLEKRYHPDRVLIEFNPFWSLGKLEIMKMPRGWGIIQEIVTVDSSCFQIYMNNMKSLFVEMVRNADMVIFNRASQELPLANFRRSVKVVNQAAEIIFEQEGGGIIDIFEDQLPYDLDQEVIDIAPEDYGIWYVDMMDNLEDYVGKTVRYSGQVLKSRDLEAGFFVPGRMAMTCCADDTQFIGYVCKWPDSKRLKMGSWVTVTAKIAEEYMEVYRDKGPVLYASEVVPAEKPEQELVYFN